MRKLEESAKMRRPVRQDDLGELGQATSAQLVDAIDDGRVEDARALARYIVPEGKALHDLLCDWLWDLLTKVAGRHGEQAMYESLKASQDTSFMRRTLKGFLKLTVLERVQATAEVLRSHRCGPRQEGDVDIIDEGDRYTIRMDPCGSGGRMRRGDPVDGTPSRLGPPYDYGVTAEAHDWSWKKKNVPYYCLHCAVNEQLSVEWGGHPLWVTGYDEDAARPCAWHFYKRASDIPEDYYTRLGFEKPADGEGRY
jgi:hypothetical protein